MGVAARATVLRARAERRSGNPAEILLWRALRARPGGFRFRRQHPIGSFIIDFACLGSRLAIEIDGAAHDRGDRPARDDRRDDDIRSRGLHMVRIPARDVFGDLDAVVRLIVGACANPLHRPAAGPPPRDGEV